jgi:hypothetical protein
MPQTTQVASDIRDRQEQVLSDWVNYQLSAVTLRREQVSDRGHHP